MIVVYHSISHTYGEVVRHSGPSSYLQSYHIVGGDRLLFDVEEEVGFSTEHSPQTGLLHLQQTSCLQVDRLPTHSYQIDLMTKY